MSLPPTSEMCWQIVKGPNSICVVLPGGATMCVSVPVATIPSAAEITKAAFQQLNAALAPLMPAMRLVEFGLAAFKTIQAVKDVPWDMKAFFDALTALVKKAQPLVSLVPGMWVPYMIGGVLDLIITYLEGLVSQLEAVVLQQARILAAATRAQQLGNADLTVMCDCATGQLGVQLDSLNAEVAPLNALIGLVNLFLSMIGKDGLPTLDNLGSDAAAAIITLRAVLVTLHDLRKLYPF